MKIIRDPRAMVETTRNGWAGLGNFDGVHLGHQSVINLARKNNPDGPIGAVTFYPHPLTVVDARRMPVPLTSLEQRFEIMAMLGLDFVVVYTFDNEFAGKSPRVFVKDLLARDLGLAGVAAGHDFLFGRGRSGDIDMLASLGKEAGLEVVVADDLVLEGRKVSSSRIRHVLGEGMVGMAAKLLGRPFFVDGRVIPGDGRGRGLGFPTVNLKVEPGLFLRDGVYAGAIRVGSDSRTYAAACHIGPVPTFDKAERVLEIHIIGLDANLYDSNVRVWFLEHLRGIEKFNDVNDLIYAIHKDVEITADLFENQDPNAFSP